jgi:hypothetical protein
LFFLPEKNQSIEKGKTRYYKKKFPGTGVLFHRATPIVLFPLFRFTAKFEMDWRGSEEARAPEK